MTEDERDDIIEMLPKDMQIWEPDEELAYFRGRDLEWWRETLEHPRAHRGCCAKCGCGSPCFMIVFADALIASTVRELARLDLLKQPPPKERS